jgi:cysteine desulfurase
MHLDLVGIQAASGSACTTGMPEPSHVLKAMGIPHELGLSALRLSLGRNTSAADIDYVLSTIPDVIQNVRTLNPAYEVVN